jgi:muconolactone delta-isomerase
MKYMITWCERPQGSPIEYENAQKRILEVFTQWKAPDNFKIELFVIRVGDWGGYMMLDCDDPLAVHKFCSMLPAFEFQARPVVPVMDAVRVELEAIAFRDGLARKRYSIRCPCCVATNSGNPCLSWVIRDRAVSLEKQPMTAVASKRTSAAPHPW